MNTNALLDYYASRLHRISQNMKKRAHREDVDMGSEYHGFDLEAMDQYANQVAAVADMLRLEMTAP
jgi:hypothetical protein